MTGNWTFRHWAESEFLIDTLPSHVSSHYHCVESNSLSICGYKFHCDSITLSQHFWCGTSYWYRCGLSHSDFSEERCQLLKWNFQSKLRKILLRSMNRDECHPFSSCEFRLKRLSKCIGTIFGWTLAWHDISNWSITAKSYSDGKSEHICCCGVFWFIYRTGCQRIIAAQTVPSKCRRYFCLFFHQYSFFLLVRFYFLWRKNKNIFAHFCIYEISIRDIFDKITGAFLFYSIIWYLAAKYLYKISYTKYYIQKWL